MQTVEGKHPHIIAYGSRTLIYMLSLVIVTHMEAFAVVWALKHFRDIIYKYPVTVYTDHSAVLQLLKEKNLSGRLARWFLTIEEFNPIIKYLPDKANVADALSRNVPVVMVQEISKSRFLVVISYACLRIW